VSGPVQYFPDATEGITRPEALPAAKVVRRSRNYPHLPCPRCGKSCFRNRTRTRLLHDVGDLVHGRPRDIELTYSQHLCTKCRKYFDADTAEYALPNAAIAATADLCAYSLGTQQEGLLVSKKTKCQSIRVARHPALLTLLTTGKVGCEYRRKTKGLESPQSHPCSFTSCRRSSKRANLL
jgi:hypothetical protein